MSKWTEARVVLREAEQGNTEKQRGIVNLFHAKMHETLNAVVMNALNPPARPFARGDSCVHRIVL